VEIGDEGMMTRVRIDLWKDTRKLTRPPHP